jgi:hypothetical protein
VQSIGDREGGAAISVGVVGVKESEYIREIRDVRDERFLVFPCAATNVAATRRAATRRAATRRAATDFIKSLQSYYTAACETSFNIDFLANFKKRMGKKRPPTTNF